MKASYYIEFISNNGVSYFQLVRGKDDAILYANQSLARVADKLFNPVYKDGSRVVLLLNN
jgi:hypothetical protein